MRYVYHFLTCDQPCSNVYRKIMITVINEPAFSMLERKVSEHPQCQMPQGLGLVWVWCQVHVGSCV